MRNRAPLSSIVRRFTFSTLLICGIAALAGCQADTDAEADETSEESLGSAKPVRLRYAALEDSGRKVVVEASASRSYSQRVDVAYATPSGWTDREAKSFRGLSPTRALYVATGLPNAGPFEFAIHHRASYASGIDQTAWDNNGGANYLATPDTPLLGEGIDVAFTGATAKAAGPGGAIELDANVLVRDIAPDKIVELHYSTDWWTTTKRLPAHHVRGGFGGAEAWKATGTFDPSVERIDFAVVVRQAGREAWDNNFEANYVCVLTPSHGFLCV